MIKVEFKQFKELNHLKNTQAILTGNSESVIETSKVTPKEKELLNC